MSCYQLGDRTPEVDASAYVAPGATVIGSVRLGPGSSIWPSAVIRADNDTITVGARTSVQEAAVLHVDPGCPLTVGEGVTIGHQAMLHGCTIGDGALIGIQAVVLNRAVIGKESLVGAGAVVTEGKVFPERSLILGAPAKVVRTLSDEDVARMRAGADSYVRRTAQFKQELKQLPDT